LGLEEAADLLDATLQEEKNADALLSKIAMQEGNTRAKAA
jgi:ferritin-like metal-binding protein YciE